jgi:hypothetical protein
MFDEAGINRPIALRKACRCDVVYLYKHFL